MTLLDLAYVGAPLAAISAGVTFVVTRLYSLLCDASRIGKGRTA